MWIFEGLGSTQSPAYSLSIDVSADTNTLRDFMFRYIQFFSRDKTVAYGLIRFLHKNYLVKV